MLENGTRAHGVALLLWDAVLVLALFHDPSCPCGYASETAARRRTGDPATAILGG
jgi:hypothetical protein